MKTKVLSIILLGASLGLGSCSDYLDMTPTDRASDKLVWSKLDYAEQAVNDFYRYIDYLGVYRDGQCLAGMTEALTDQLKYGSYNYMAKCQIPSEIAYGGSVLTVNYVSTYLGNWGTMYEYVRRVNEGINKLKKYASFNQTDEERLEAEMRFFRAYFYFEKVKRYGDIPWYDKALDSDDPELYKARDSREFVMQKMLEDLDFAIANLPKTKNAYVLTRWTALALKSRVCLFEGTFRKYHGLEDYEKYLNACVSASETFMNESGYTLYKSGSTPYRDLFASINLQADEVIFGRDYEASLSVLHNVQNYENSTTMGRPGMNKKIVNSYLMADGSRFTDKAGYETMTFDQEC